MNKFAKADLKPGMIVETRNNNMYMIHEFDNKLVLINESLINKNWLRLTDYKEDLSFYDKKLESLDIVNVRKPDETYQLIKAYWRENPIIWERKELPKITEVERVILENARVEGKRAKWIGRDRNRWMRLYNNKPEKGKDAWISNLGDYVWFNAYNHLFQFVKWEDEEPWYIPDLLEEVDG